MAYDSLLDATYIRQVELNAGACKLRKAALAKRAAVKRAALITLRDRMIAAGAKRVSDVTPKASEARAAGTLAKRSRARKRHPVNTTPGFSPELPREAFRPAANRALNRRTADHSAASNPIPSAGAPKYRTGRGRIVEVK